MDVLWQRVTAMSTIKCKAHIFTGQKDSSVWTFCNDCAPLYRVKDSPVIYMGNAEFSQIVTCDCCKKPVIRPEDDTDPDLPKPRKLLKSLGLDFSSQ
jgi:hypothetical protein